MIHKNLLFLLQVLDIVRNTINDERVELSVVNSFDPLPISPYDESNFGYQILQRTIYSVFSGVAIAPGTFFSKIIKTSDIVIYHLTRN